MLRARRLRVEEGAVGPGRGGVTIHADRPEIRPCGCGLGQLLWLRARSARWRSDEGRVHLHWPVVGVGKVPLLAAPYWSVPTRHGTSGLLAPRLGYSARDGVRVAQPVYLALRDRADLALAVGAIQRRGPTGELTARYFSTFRGDGELALRGVWEGSRLRGWSSGGATLRGRSWSLRLEPNLVSDASVLSELAETTVLEVSTYRRSRLWGGLQAESVSILGWLDLYQSLGSPVQLGRGRLLRGQLRLAGAPVFWGPVALTTEAELIGAGGAGDETPALVGVDDALRLTRGVAVWLAPSLTLHERVGPLRGAALLGYRLRGVWGGDAGPEGESPAVAQAAVLAAEVGLPLTRAYVTRAKAPAPRGDARRGRGGWLHEIEPYLAWQSLVELDGSLDGPLLVDQQVLAPGHFFGLGVRSSLRSVGRGLRRRLMVDGRLLAGDKGSLVLLRGEGALGVHFRGRLRLLYDVERRSLAGAEGRICSGWASLRSCVGYRRHRGAPAELAPFAPDSLWPALAGAAGVFLLAEQLNVVTARVELRLSRARLGAQVFVDPLRGVLTHGRYWLSLFDRCRCLGIDLSARSRPAGGVPDVLLGLRIEPDWGTGCRSSRAQL